jgi:DNA-binding CsgD family transcriptional regulator
MTVIINLPLSANSYLSLSNTAEAFINKEFKSIDVDLSSLKNSKDTNKKDKPKNVVANSDNTIIPIVGKMEGNLLNKEISYNKDVSVTSLSGNSALNIYTLTSEKDELFNLGLYYGFALTMVFLNIVCFLLFDEKVFLFYTMVLAGLTSVFFYNDGLMVLFGAEQMASNAILESTLLLATVGAGALFASKYIRIKEHYPFITKVVIPLYIVAALLVTTAWISGNEVLTKSANAVSYGILSIYFIAGVMLFSRKNYVKFYVVASFIPLLFTIDYFVLRGFEIEFLFTDPVHIKVAVLAEMLLMTYAIIFRMKAIKEENELRQTEMRIFLKRQDVMHRKNVEQMVEDVYLENLIMHYDLDGLEIKLLQYISEGKTNEKIARKLKLSESELEEQTKLLYEKLEIGEQIQEDYRMLDNQPDYLYN